MLSEAHVYPSGVEMKSLRGHLTPSLVISVIALFVALSGASYAALRVPNNSVGTKQIKAKAVTTAKLAPNAVDSARVRDGSITGNDVKLHSLGSKAIDPSVLPHLDSGAGGSSLNPVALPALLSDPSALRWQGSEIKPGYYFFFGVLSVTTVSKSTVTCRLEAGNQWLSPVSGFKSSVEMAGLSTGDVVVQGLVEVDSSTPTLAFRCARDIAGNAGWNDASVKLFRLADS